MDIGLIITAVLATATNSGCSWAHPGANPYRGDPVAALAHFEMPDDTRRKLRTLMAAHRYTDVVKITRDDIQGSHGYGDLRDMHSGGGLRCHGSVDRSAWDPKREERGLVYCVDDTCVIVPTICNNVSLVTRRPETAGIDDGPLDIEPAAGPPAGAGNSPAPIADAAPAGSESDRAQPSFIPADLVGVTELADVLPPGDADYPIAGVGGGGGGGGTTGGGGGVTPVPELPAWTLLLSGLALLGLLRRRGSR